MHSPLSESIISKSLKKAGSIKSITVLQIYKTIYNLTRNIGLNSLPSFMINLQGTTLYESLIS